MSPGGDLSHVNVLTPSAGGFARGSVVSVSGIVLDSGAL